MSMSVGEKVIIALLLDIHKNLGVKGDVDAKAIHSALYSGNLWSLEWDLSYFLGQDEPSEDVVKETTKILDMWRIIEGSLANLSGPELKRVKEDSYPFFDDEFPGFDANNDPHYGVAWHLINNMGRYSERHGKELNSHSISNLPRYQKMLVTYSDILRKKAGTVHFTAEELIEVFKSPQVN